MRKEGTKRTQNIFIREIYFSSEEEKTSAMRKKRSVTGVREKRRGFNSRKNDSKIFGVIPL